MRRTLAIGSLVVSSLAFAGCAVEAEENASADQAAAKVTSAESAKVLLKEFGHFERVGNGLCTSAKTYCIRAGNGSSLDFVSERGMHDVHAISAEGSTLRLRLQQRKDPFTDPYPEINPSYTIWKTARVTTRLHPRWDTTTLMDAEVACIAASPTDFLIAATFRKGTESMSETISSDFADVCKSALNPPTIGPH